MLTRKCDGCHREKLFVSYMKVKHPVIGTITSKGRFCRNCHKSLKKTTCTT